MLKAKDYSQQYLLLTNKGGQPRAAKVRIAAAIIEALKKTLVKRRTRRTKAVLATVDEYQKLYDAFLNKIDEYSASNRGIFKGVLRVLLPDVHRLYVTKNSSRSTASLRS